MNLAVPLTNVNEAEILHEAGATEFYCGIQTTGWEGMFGNHDSISRRQGSANMAKIDELEQLLVKTGELSVPLFLTLNSFYTEEQLPYVLEIAETFEDLGGTGIMVCDLGLLGALKKRKSRLIRGLSLLAAASSVSAVYFYQELGVSRVVFPRFLSVEQMKIMVASCPNIQWEAIVWIDKCSFIDGFCRFIHGVGYASDSGRDAGSPCRKIIYSHDTNYMLPACFELFGKPVGTPACAACSLASLADAGVEVFKVGGRGRSLETRLTGTRFLTDAFNRKDNQRQKELYHHTFGEECGPACCYYQM